MTTPDHPQPESGSTAAPVTDDSADIRSDARSDARADTETDTDRHPDSLASAETQTKDAAESARNKAAPDTELPPLDGEEDTTNLGVDRGFIIGEGVASLSRWSLRLIIIAVAAGALWWLLGKIWVGVFPVLLALIVSTILWPPTAWLRRKGVPGALAAVMVLLGSLAAVVGIFAAITPSLVGQGTELANSASDGVSEIRDRLSKEPFNLDNKTIQDGLAQAQSWIQERSGDIASGVFSGVSILTSALVTLALVLVLTFFFLKDGPNFLPFVRRMAGREAGRHLTEVATRSWNTLGGFIRTQAIVSAVDAVLIGLGLFLLNVPLAFALAILTFFGGFIPIVGAFAVGTLAVLVALVGTQSLTTALLVLLLILAVQQIEGNVLQPFLQGRSMQLHAGVILLAVAAGGTLFGVVGAFLAVPVAAVSAVIIRYMSEQVDLRAGDLRADEVKVATKDGEISAKLGEAAAATYAEATEGTANAGRTDSTSPLTPAAARARDLAGTLRQRLRRKD